MIISFGNSDYNLSDALLSSIVRAIEKAVTEDIPGQLYERPLETNNYLAFIRGDFINENLRAMAVQEGGMMHCFQRFGWRGRLLIDRENRLTISVATENTLNQIPRKDRRRPHFMQSLLHSLNGDLHGEFEQTRLFDTDPFDDETYAADFRDIACGEFDPADGYRHLVVAYRASGFEIISIRLVVLDPFFNTVAEYDLVEYMRPDFAQLTAVNESEDEERQEHNEATRKLPALKPGLRPALREEEKQA